MLSRITGLLSRIADLFVSILCTFAYIIGIHRHPSASIGIKYTENRVYSFSSETSAAPLNRSG